MPSYHDYCSKIKMKCPDCQDVTELYDFLIDRIMCAPASSIPIPTVDVLSISPRDPNPDPAARSHYWQKVWACIGRRNNSGSMHDPLDPFDVNGIVNVVLDSVSPTHETSKSRRAASTCRGLLFHRCL